MEIRKKSTGDVVEVDLTGRLDGYWCDHLDAALAEIVREGKHHIALDCSQVSFLSSAGISVLMKFHQELAAINGTFRVVNPSARVATVLRVTRLDPILVAAAGPAAPVADRERPARRIERNQVAFDVFDLNPGASLTCRSVGSAEPIASRAFAADRSLEAMSPALAVGVGAFGESFSDCRKRFGEMVSVAGATAYQPADGTNVADYLVASGALGADVRVLYCLLCEGRFSHLLRFETLQAGGSVGLSHLLTGCLETAETDSMGVVIVAEAAGLVGAALRQSPTEVVDERGFFAHPEVRTRLAFTAERAFGRSVAMAAGVVTRAARGNGHNDQIRPIGPDCSGHIHAAAFRFRPIKKGPIELHETVAGLFEPDRLLGVLHLLHDDRGIAGAGESEFVRGACWVGPIAGDWPTA